MGTGRTDEKTKSKASWGYKMTNVKAQSSNQIQNPNDKKVILKLSHLTLDLFITLCALRYALCDY